MVVALLWSAFGFSWSAVIPLFGILYGTTIAATYGLFRLLMGKMLALIGSCIWLFTFAHLSMLPQLRDYSKAPFIIVSILIMGYLVQKPISRASTLAWSTLCGIVVGIGIGFREDVLIVVPAFVFVALAFFPVATNLSRTILLRIGTVAVFLIAFFLSAQPILAGIGGGGNTFHVLLLGLMQPFDKNLGITTPIYQWGYQYKDMLIVSILSTYAYCVDGLRQPLTISNQLYDQIGSRYFTDIVKNFPADMLLRAYAAVIYILNWPYRLLKFDILQNTGIFIAIIALILLSYRRIRPALFWIFIVVYFCGYSTLQFHTRHYFHLIVIAFLLLGFVIQQFINLIGVLRRPSGRTMLDPKNWQRDQIWRPSRHVVAFMFVLAVLWFLPLFALRQYQQAHLENLLEQYLSAPVDKLNTIDTTTALGTTLIKSTQPFPTFVPQTTQPKQPMLHAEYLVIDVETAAPTVPITLRYETTGSKSVWDRTQKIIQRRPTGLKRTTPTRTRYIYPIFTGPLTEFTGIEVSPKLRSAIKGIYRMEDSCSFPLLLWWTVPSDFKDATLFQQIK